MFSIDDLYKMLQEKSADDIAKEFTDALNAAEKKNSDVESKRQDAQAVRDAFVNYLNKWHNLEVMDDLTVEEVMKSMDEAAKFYTTSISLFKSIF